MILKSLKLNLNQNTKSNQNLFLQNNHSNPNNNYLPKLKIIILKIHQSPKNLSYPEDLEGQEVLARALKNQLQGKIQVKNQKHCRDQILTIRSRNLYQT